MQQSDSTQIETSFRYEQLLGSIHSNLKIRPSNLTDPRIHIQTGLQGKRTALMSNRSQCHGAETSMSTFTSYSDRRFCVSYILFIIIIGGILVLFIYIKRLASNKIFSPSHKIHREVGRTKDLSEPRYIYTGVLVSP